MFPSHEKSMEALSYYLEAALRRNERIALSAFILTYGRLWPGLRRIPSLGERTRALRFTVLSKGCCDL